MTARVLIFGLCLFVGGCASRAEVAAGDDALCQSYGAQPGSDAYVQCRMEQDGRRDQRRRDILNTPLIPMR
jgi:hypothetical protein